MAKIDTSRWKEYEIGKLFEISRPVTRSQAKYSEGNIPFVASGNFNNGVVKYCEPEKDEVLDGKNCITVSPLDGSAFYQPDDFLGRGGAGSAILMLRNPNLDEKNGLFLATAIRASLTKYTYSDQLNSQKIASENIEIPVDSHGCPDWTYMDEYMSAVMRESEASLESLRQTDGEKHALNIDGWRRFHLSKTCRTVRAHAAASMHDANRLNAARSRSVSFAIWTGSSTLSPMTTRLMFSASRRSSRAFGSDRFGFALRSRRQGGPGRSCPVRRDVPRFRVCVSSPLFQLGWKSVLLERNDATLPHVGGIARA